MTDREPFAKVFKYGINIGGVECFSEEPDDREVAKAINAAFNARVDAEVQKAVAEMDAEISNLKEELKFAKWTNLEYRDEVEALKNGSHPGIRIWLRRR